MNKLQSKRILPEKNVLWFATLLFVTFIFPIGVFPSIIMSNLMRDLNVSVFQASITASAFYYTYVFIQWPIGLLLDRYGAVIILRICISLSILGLLIFYFSESFHVAVFSRILTGFAGGAAVPVALFIAHHGFSTKKFLVLAGMIEFVAMTSAGVSQLFLSRLINVYNWRTLVLFFTIIAIILSFFYFLFIKKAHKIYHEFTNAPEKLKIKFSYSMHVFFNGIISGIMFSLVVGFFGYWCITYLTDVYYFTLPTAGAVSCIGFIAAGVFAPVLGFFLRDLYAQYYILLLGICLALFFSLLLVSKILPYYMVPILILLSGIASSVYVIPFAFVGKNCPTSVVGTTLSIVNILCGCVGSLIFIPLIGFLIDGDNGFGWSLTDAMYIFPLSFFIALLLSLYFKNTLLFYEHEKGY